MPIQLCYDTKGKIDENNDSTFLNSHTVNDTLSYFLTNISESGELINRHLPTFTAYMNGKQITVLADSGAQRTVAKTGSFLTEKSKISKCNMSFRAANSTQLQVDGQLDIISFNIFNDFEITLNNVPLLASLPYDVLLGFPDLQKLGFSLPKGDSSYFKLSNYTIKINQPDYRILKTGKFTKINPSYENTVLLKNPFYQLSNAENLLISPLDKLSKNNRLVITPMLVRNDEFVCVIISTDRPNTFIVPKDVPVCRLEPVDHNLIQSLETTDNFEAEIEQCKLFQTERKRLFNISNDQMPNIKEIGPLSESDRNKLNQVLILKNLAFSTKDPKDLGHIFCYKFRIKLKDNDKICYQPPRILPPGVRADAQAEFENWKSRGMVRESTSQFNSPVLIIKKGENKKSTRLVLDSRSLNSNTIVEKTPIPHAQSIIYELGTTIAKNNKFFLTKIDMAKAYNQMLIHPDDSQYSAFSFEGKSWEPTRVAYGFAAAPASWHRLMRNIFDGLPICLFFDDIVFVNGTFEEHLTIFSEILSRCIKFGLLVDPQKCHICVLDTQVLGVRVTKNGILPSESHTKSVESYPTPVCKKDVKKFLGLATFISRHIPQASVILSPLHKLTSPKASFLWSETHEEAFSNFKKMTTSAPGLAHRNEQFPLYMVSDASGYKISAILYQKTDDNILQPLSYFSRMLTSAEQRTGSRVREIYAIADGIKHFEFFLIGQFFHVYTDHYSLKWLMTSHKSQNLNIRLMNILAYLHRFSFDITHMKNTSPEIIATDALTKAYTLDDLSREPTESAIPQLINSLLISPIVSFENGDVQARYALRENVQYSNSDNLNNDDFAPNDKISFQFNNQTFGIDEMINYQKSDVFCNKVMSQLSNKSPKTKFSRSTKKKFIIKGGILYCKKAGRLVIVLPTQISYDFISYYHKSYLHPGGKAMEHIINGVAHIHCLQKLVRDITASCEDCLRNKITKPLRPKKAINRSFSQHPFQRCYVDLIQLKSDIHRKCFLLTMTDEMSHYIDGEPISSKKDTVVSEALTKLMLRNAAFGCIVHDRGSEWIGPLVRNICKKIEYSCN